MVTLLLRQNSSDTQKGKMAPPQSCTTVTTSLPVLPKPLGGPQMNHTDQACNQFSTSIVVGPPWDQLTALVNILTNPTSFPNSNFSTAAGCLCIFAKWRKHLWSVQSCRMDLKGWPNGENQCVFVLAVKSTEMQAYRGNEIEFIAISICRQRHKRSQRSPSI